MNITTEITKNVTPDNAKESVKGIVAKLVQVMGAVEHIPKRGYNKFHGYKYATESDVADSIRGELVKQNVLLLPSVVSRQIREHTTRKGGTEYLEDVDIDFTFLDGDTGEMLGPYRMSGTGQDAGDKSIYKAVTGCEKYFLMKAFLIPTGDDPERDNGGAIGTEKPNKAPDKPKSRPKSEPAPTNKPNAQEAARRAFFAQVGERAEKHGFDATEVKEVAKGWLQDKYNVESTSKIPPQQWPLIIKPENFEKLWGGVLEVLDATDTRQAQQEFAEQVQAK